MWNPFLDFPREIGYPNRAGLIWNVEDLIERVNKYNMRSTVFVSLYGFNEVNKEKGRGLYNSARLNQLYFDLDEPTSLEPINNLHNYCLQKDLIHTILFSGGGIHTYIGTNASTELKNKKGALTNSQIFIADECGLSIGINDGFDIDGHIIGNLAQMVRVPGTYNLKRKRFCIPLREDDLKTSIEEISQKATKQIFGLTVWGSKFFDLSPFDSEPKTKNYDLDIKLETEKNINEDSIRIESFPPCIKNLVAKKNLIHHERYLLILYCKELGLGLSDVIGLLKKILPPSVFHHCAIQEKQIFWCFRRNDLVFPSCEKLKFERLCPIDCGGAKLYG